MRDVTETHRQAMLLAERALQAKAEGRHAEAAEHLNAAFQKEREAADCMRAREGEEPTRSVLYRSAASLALQCGLIREAERLIAVGLSGNPPDEIAEELRDLLENTQFRRHLKVRGAELGDGEFQLSISGSAVGYGIASLDAFLDRIQTTQRLLVRSAERKLGKPLRERGAPPKEVRESFPIFVSVARAASFAVTLRVGAAQGLLGFAAPELGPQELIDEVMTCLELFNESRETELKHRIPDADYRRNFLGLARALAPDGKRVKLVGLTSGRGRDTREVSLTLPRSEAVRDTGPGPESAELVTVTGKLLLADAVSETHSKISVVDDQGTQHKIHVPSGMMADIVRPLWEYSVTVKGRRGKGEIINLEEVTKEED